MEAKQKLESAPQFMTRLSSYLDHWIQLSVRLSSHWLAIETGRWSRKRREDRLCTCGEIQTEKHVITQCGRTEHIRAAYPNLDWVSWPNMLYEKDTPQLCSCIYDVNKEFMLN